MDNLLKVEDIQEMTGKGYFVALEYLKLVSTHKIGTAYVVNKDDFIKWAERNNIELANTQPLEQ